MFRARLAYVLSIHLGIAGTALLPVLSGWPPVLPPLHIVFLELIIDSARSIAFEAEPEDPETMHQRPRPRDVPILSSKRAARDGRSGRLVERTLSFWRARMGRACRRGCGWDRRSGLDRPIEVHGAASLSSSGEPWRKSCFPNGRTLKERIAVMNWDQIKAEWKDIKGKARVQWGKLTDDELARVRGNREQLEAALQKRYGIAKEEAQRQVDDWAQKLKRAIEPR